MKKIRSAIDVYTTKYFGIDNLGIAVACESMLNEYTIVPRMFKYSCDPFSFFHQKDFLRSYAFGFVRLTQQKLYPYTQDTKYKIKKSSIIRFTYSKKCKWRIKKVSIYQGIRQCFQWFCIQLNVHWIKLDVKKCQGAKKQPKKDNRPKNWKNKNRNINRYTEYRHI